MIVCSSRVCQRNALVAKRVRSIFQQREDSFHAIMCNVKKSRNVAGGLEDRGEYGSAGRNDVDVENL